MDSHSRDLFYMHLLKHNKNHGAFIINSLNARVYIAFSTIIILWSYFGYLKYTIIVCLEKGVNKICLVYCHCSQFLLSSFTGFSFFGGTRKEKGR